MKTDMENLDTSHMELCRYDPKWAEMYNQESQKIRALLGDKITEIEHIGSTSIPGLASKPIIDVAVVVPSWKDAESLIGPLSTLGYRSEVSNVDESNAGERLLFRKGNPTQFHLSIAYADRGSFLERQILFRDYLRTHDEERDEYYKLKKDLLTKDPTGKSSYIEGKTDFVMRALKRSGFKNPWFDLSKYN
jgi:GrpB-like predicted nucleotidyltransferase (UPF0157 family)